MPLSKCIRNRTPSRFERFLMRSIKIRGKEKKTKIQENCNIVIRKLLEFRIFKRAVYHTFLKILRLLFRNVSRNFTRYVTTNQSKL